MKLLLSGLRVFFFLLFSAIHTIDQILAALKWEKKYFLKVGMQNNHFNVVFWVSFFQKHPLSIHFFGEDKLRVVYSMFSWLERNVLSSRSSIAWNHLKHIKHCSNANAKVVNEIVG